MKIYGVKLSPFVMRPLLVARAKGHELTLEVPEGGIKTDSYHGDVADGEDAGAPRRRLSPPRKPGHRRISRTRSCPARR